MTLYWGVRSAGDLYLLDLIDAWQREHPNFRFVPVLSHAGDDTHLDRPPRPRARGACSPTIRTSSGYEVYACGSVKMVEAAVPDFLAHGLGEQFCFSDAFVPASRAT